VHYATGDGIPHMPIRFEPPPKIPAKGTAQGSQSFRGRSASAAKALFSIADQADRAPRALADGEVLDLGGKRVRRIDTPHVPHGWVRVRSTKKPRKPCSPATFYHRRKIRCTNRIEFARTRGTLRRYDAVHVSYAEHGADDRAARRPQAQNARAHAQRAFQGDGEAALRELAGFYRDRASSS
jgi:hypothetical protein